MKYLGRAALAAAFLVSGCGGEDGGSSGGGSTPPPPAAMTYTKFADLTGVQNFQTACAGQEIYNGQDYNLGGYPFGDTVRIRSDRSGPTYDVEVANIGFQGGRSLNFTQAHLDPSSTATSERYNYDDFDGRTQRLTISVPRVNDAELEYVRIAAISSPGPSGFDFLLCAFGVPTDLKDIPSSSVNYVSSSTAAILRLREIGYLSSSPVKQYSAVNTTATGFGDPATGVVRFSIDLKGNEINGGTTSEVVTNLGSYSGETSIDGTETSFSGVVVNADNVVVGDFGGWYFGPQGRTMAVSYSIQDRRADDSEVISAGLLFLRR